MKTEYDANIKKGLPFLASLLMKIKF